MPTYHRPRICTFRRMGYTNSTVGGFMGSKTRIRNLLLEKGFFPEVLPPCFDSTDLTKGFRGLIKKIDAAKFHKGRSTKYARYSGTKHDGNRRLYSTVNPISYFNVCTFISENWLIFEEKFSKSSFRIEPVRLGAIEEDRAVIIPPLSELINQISRKIRYSPYLVKTDIAQFYPSIYTHSISWAAHGIEESKADQDTNSKTNTFNQLDWFIQQCQNSQTRGVVIGPDAFRIIAEFISCELDHQFSSGVGNNIIGAVRHVDDFYIGVENELIATSILSQLRDVLQNYELQINDNKTKIISGLEPQDDLWAQELRKISVPRYSAADLSYALDKAFSLTRTVSSESPMKLILRRMDKAKCYDSDMWSKIEQKLQRILFHFPHCVDYVCLLLAKRHAIGKNIDKAGWKETSDLLIRRAVRFNHHHELAWIIWVRLVCDLGLDSTLVDEISRNDNPHIKALMIAGYKAHRFETKPDIRLGGKLSTTDENWLVHLTARVTGYSKAPFSGHLSAEFEHLAKKKTLLINFARHIEAMADRNKSAISNSKYGYDDETDFDETDLDDDLDDILF